MKKILFVFSLLLSSVFLIASDFGVPSVIDFGSNYSIKGKPYVTDSLEIPLNPTGISGGNGIGLEVTEGDYYNDGIFYIEDSWTYDSGYTDYYNSVHPKIYFWATEAGTFTGKLTLTNYNNDETFEITLKVTVQADAIVEQTTTFVKITSISELKANDVIVLANEQAGVISGELSNGHFTAINANFNSQNSTVEVGKSAQTFTVGTYSEYWKLTATGDNNYLQLKIDNSSKKEVVSFTSGEKSTSDIAVTSNWDIAIINGNATISKPLADEYDDLYSIYYVEISSGNFFKSYKDANSYSANAQPIQIYKKSGEAHNVETSIKNNSDNGIIISRTAILNPQGQQLRVYSIEGQLLMISNENIEIGSLQSGIYLLQTANEVIKFAK